MGVVGTILALAVYTRDRREWANRSFAATTVGVIAWLSFAFLSDTARDHAQALLFNRLALAAAIAIGMCLAWFALVFPNRRERIGVAWPAFMLLGFAIATTTVFTPLVVADVQFRSYGTDIVAGDVMPLFSAWVIFGAIFLGWLLRRKYQSTDGREKAQLKYLLLGIVLFSSFSALFGIVLPAFTGSYLYTIFNTFTPLFLIGFTSYAMIRHRLMDMRLVVLRGVVYTALVALFALFYLALAQLARAGFVLGLNVSSDAAFVLGGLAAVFAFQPLRSGLERLTDHFFYRRQYDERTLLESLSVQLVGMVDLSEIATAATRVLSERLKASRIALVHKEGDTIVAYGEGIDSNDPALAEILEVAPDGRPVLDHELDESSPVLTLLEKRGIKVIAPLVTEEGATAVLLLGDKQSGEAYTEQDMRFLQALSAELAVALKTCELFEQREQRVRELTALNRLASALGQDIQLDSLLNRALRQVVSVAGADGGSIMLFDPASDELVIRAGFGLSSGVVHDTRLARGEGIAGWVAEHSKPLLVMDAESGEFHSEFERTGIRSALSVPLVAKDRVTGVLNLRRFSSSASFSQQNMSVVNAFASQLAVAIENAQLYSDLEGYFLGTITALATAVDAKDPYTYGHSSEVTDATLAIAAEMGLDEKQTETLRMAAILHDIGKIGIDGAILNKPGPLDPDERVAITRHPTIGANILSSLEFLEEVVPIVLYHHERYDGQGYPEKIGGEDIPLGARIISVADSYNAMTSDRTYRRALPRAEAAAELKRCAGTQFDPDVVAAFLRVLEAQDEPGLEFAVVGVGHNEGREG